MPGRDDAIADEFVPDPQVCREFHITSKTLWRWELPDQKTPMVDIPRDKYLGERLGEGPASEAEHFIRCPACGGWIDCRDLSQVFEHEGPLPHPAQDQPQGRGE